MTRSSRDISNYLAEFWDVFFGGDFEKYGQQRFTAYYDEVINYVGKENLLLYRVSDGWGPLCKFLDVPVPLSTPFPRVNDTDGFVQRCKTRNRRQMLNVVFRYTMVCVLAALFMICTLQIRQAFLMHH